MIIIKSKLNIFLVFSLLVSLMFSPIWAKDRNEPFNYLISLEKQSSPLNKLDLGEFVLSPYFAPQKSQERLIIDFSISKNLDSKSSLVRGLSLSSEKININQKISSLPDKSPLSSDKLDKSLFTASLISYSLLNVADYFSTREALKYEGVEEANPLLKPFVKNDMVFVTLKLGMTASNVYLLQKLHQKDKTLAWIITGLCNAAFSYVVIHNLKVIRKVQNQN